MDHIINIINRKKLFFIIPFSLILIFSILYIQNKGDFYTVHIAIFIPEKMNEFINERQRAGELQELVSRKADSVSTYGEGEVENINIRFREKDNIRAVRGANEIAEEYAALINKEAERKFKFISAAALPEVRVRKKKARSEFIKKNIELEKTERALEAFERKQEKTESAMQGLKKELARLETEKATVSRIYTPLHPSVLVLTEEINEIQMKINKMSKPDLEGGVLLEGEARELRREQEDLKANLRLLEERKKTFETGYREFASVSKYANPLGEIPGKTNNNFMLFSLGFIIAIFAGGTSLYVSAAKDNSICTEKAMSDLLSVPILGQIPYLKPSFLIRKKAKLDSRLLFAYENDFTAFEAFKSTYMHMERDLFKANKKGAIILITSADRLEGKSLISFNLGLTIAQSKKDALLVDCNLRSPSMQGFFGLKDEKGHGLSDILNRKKDASETMKNVTELLVEGGVRWMDRFTPMGIDRLKIINAGSNVMNTSDLLGSERTDELLANLRANHDFIILDSPAINTSTDALILSQKADYVIFVYKTAVTARKDLIEAKEKMSKVKAAISGVIFNNTSKLTKLL